ncbi:MAG: hypothetical protein JSW40_04755, partial [Candidatus Omnitrophota bacterium]
PLSILGSIVGEFVGSSNGLGFLILSSSYYARTADMLACIFIVSLCGIAVYQTVCVLERRFIFWHGTPRTKQKRIFF